MLLYNAFVVLWYTLLTCVQGKTCPPGGYPSNLAVVGIWTKLTDDGRKVFRIGGNELEDEYTRAIEDEILLNRGEPHGCPEQCIMQLDSSGNKVISSYKEKLQSLYCARAEGDCGAKVPIYRYKKKTNSVDEYAYSLQPVERIGGYLKEANPVCYAWRDSDYKSYDSGRDSTCHPLPQVEHGEIIYEPQKAELYVMGSTAKLKCESGYKPSSLHKVVCINSAWYPMSEPFRCLPMVNSSSGLPANCSPLPVHENGHILYSQHGTTTFPSGTLAYLICNGHYRSALTRQSRCDRGEWSAVKLGTCELMTNNSCSSMVPPDHGKINYMMGSANEIKLGTVAELQCDPGYVPSGTDAIICEQHGWVPQQTLGNCTRDNKYDDIQRDKRQGTRQCATGLPLVFNGQIAYTNNAGLFGSYPSGTIAVMRCNTGYTINGVFLSTCEDSVWQPPSMGTCVATPGIVPVRSGNACPFALATPVGGKIVYNRGGPFGPYPSGTTATLDCGIQRPSGPTLAVCDNGSWIPNEIGTCLSGVNANTGFGGELGSCLSDYPKPQNGAVTYSNGRNQSPYPPGTIANIQCNLGYSPAGTLTATCKDGLWSPSPSTECVRGTGVLEKTRGKLHQVPIVNTGIRPGVGVGIGLSCPGGMPLPINGIYTYSNGIGLGPFPSGTVATLVCNLGFTPAGAASSTCTNGVWAPPTPGQCIRSTGVGPGLIGGTGPLSVGAGGAPCAAGFARPINGQITYSNGLETGPFPSGTIATVVCNMDYVPNGPASSTCINGVFTPPIIPQCVPEGGLLAAGNGLRPFELPCLPLASPIHGEVTFSESAVATYPSRTVANLVCDLGYIASGSLESTCINGQWSPPLGVCQQGLIGPGSIGLGIQTSLTQCAFEIPAVGNGQIRYSNNAVLPPFDSGTSATLTCNFGSTPIGMTVSTCTNGVWNPPVLGECPLNDDRRVANAPSKECAAMPPSKYGKVLYSRPSNSSYFKLGTTATLVCEPHYNVSGASVVRCKDGIWTPWPGIGICQLNKEDAASACAPILKPPNGNVSYDEEAKSDLYMNGTIARLECEYGYAIAGSKIASCQNGAWIPLLGICQFRIDPFQDTTACKAIDVQPHGKVYYAYSSYVKDYQSGTAAILSCDQGYIVDGQTTLTCNGTHWVPDSGFGVCKSENDLKRF